METGVNIHNNFPASSTKHYSKILNNIINIQLQAAFFIKSRSRPKLQRQANITIAPGFMIGMPEMILA